MVHLIQHPTRVSDQHTHATSHSLCLLICFLNPILYVLSPQVSFDHNLITASCSALPSSQRKADRSSQALSLIWPLLSYGILSEFLLGEILFFFTWYDSMCRVKEIIMAGMEAYIPCSLSCTSNIFQPWFDGQCSEAVRRDYNYGRSFICKQ